MKTVRSLDLRITGIETAMLALGRMMIVYGCAAALALAGVLRV